MNVPKSLAHDDYFNSLSDERKCNFANRLKYLKEISEKELKPSDDLWFYISSLQIDIDAIITGYSDFETNISLLSIERWADDIQSLMDDSCPAKRGIDELYKSLLESAANDDSIRSWLKQWNNSLVEIVRVIFATPDRREAVLHLVAANCLIYLAMSYFSRLRFTVGFR